MKSKREYQSITGWFTTPRRGCRIWGWKVRFSVWLTCQWGVTLFISQYQYPDFWTYPGNCLSSSPLWGTLSSASTAYCNNMTALFSSTSINISHYHQAAWTHPPVLLLLTWLWHVKAHFSSGSIRITSTNPISGNGLGGGRLTKRVKMDC